MPDTLPSEFFQGLSIYQDVVLDGHTVLSGERDCASRWKQIAPHLPILGTVLDIGSNFGWFGYQLCQHAPGCVVCSVEADERSAAVQRRVLASNEAQRIALLTRPAGARMARRFASAGQRFDAVLCLAVLHWMRDHRSFLQNLAPMAGRIFIEHPDPCEAGAGIEHIRREIGPIGTYLRGIFADRRVRQIGELASHRDTPYRRQLWLVEEPVGWSRAPSPGLDATALLDSALSWPPRSWWVNRLTKLDEPRHARARCVFTATGLQSNREVASHTLHQLQRRVERLPEYEVFTFRERSLRRARRWLGQLRTMIG